MPANVHKPDDVDAYMARLDHPLKAEVQAVRETILGVHPRITSMADVQARRAALQALVRQWVDLMDQQGG